MAGLFAERAVCRFGSVAVAFVRRRPPVCARGGEVGALRRFAEWFSRSDRVGRSRFARDDYFGRNRMFALGCQRVIDSFRSDSDDFLDDYGDDHPRRDGVGERRVAVVVCRDVRRVVCERARALLHRSADRKSVAAARSIKFGHTR